MRGRRSRRRRAIRFPAGGRAISTVFDVSMALILISASVVVVATYLDGEESQPNTDEADQLAATLAATTITSEYSLGAIADATGNSYDSAATTDRNAHGSATELLAEAAVTDAEVDGTQLSVAGESFTENLRGDVRDRLTGADTNADVVAVWEPYPDSDVRGRVEVGVEPPSGADVSTATITVNNQLPHVSNAEIVSRFDDDGYDGVADLLAGAIVEGYFPPQETQLALEQQGFERVVAVYRYERFETVLNGWTGASSPSISYDSPGVLGPSYISRTGADVGIANDQVQATMAAGIEDDLADSFGPEADVTGQEIARDISAQNVTVTVRTWDQ